MQTICSLWWTCRHWQLQCLEEAKSAAQMLGEYFDIGCFCRAGRFARCPCQNLGSDKIWQVVTLTYRYIYNYPNAFYVFNARAQLFAPLNTNWQDYSWSLHLPAPVVAIRWVLDREGSLLPKSCSTTLHWQTHSQTSMVTHTHTNACRHVALILLLQAPPPPPLGQCKRWWWQQWGQPMDCAGDCWHSAAVWESMSFSKFSIGCQMQQHDYWESCLQLDLFLLHFVMLHCHTASVCR